MQVFSLLAGEAGGRGKRLKASEGLLYTSCHGVQSHMAVDVVEKIAHLRARLGTLVLHLRDKTLAAGLAFLDFDDQAAQQIVSSHTQIESEIAAFQEECCVAIARYQPVARDLHDIMLLYRISYDFNRMAGLSLSVARKTLKVVREAGEPLDRETMTAQIEQVGAMLDDCCKLVTNPQQALTHKIKQANAEVTSIKRQMKEATDRAIAAHPEDTGVMFYLFAVSRHYDRIADLTSSVCEEIMALKD